MALVFALDRNIIPMMDALIVAHANRAVGARHHRLMPRRTLYAINGRIC